MWTGGCPWGLFWISASGYSRHIEWNTRNVVSTLSEICATEISSVLEGGHYMSIGHRGPLLGRVRWHIAWDTRNVVSTLSKICVIEISSVLEGGRYMSIGQGWSRVPYPAV